MTRISRWLALLMSLTLLVLALPIPQVYAEEDTGAQMATKISKVDTVVDHKGFYNPYVLFDGDKLVQFNAGVNASLTLEYQEGIGSVYFIFGAEPGAYTVTNNDTGESRTWGETRFLHEFLDLEGAFGTAPKSVTFQFGEEQLFVNELEIFTSGQVPETIQRWDVPKEDETDLILFSSHGDDEQLFFAGVLPYYAKELNYEVLVVYLTDHRNLTKQRIHEMLNGLWSVGVRTYPVFGSFPDFFVQDKQAAYSIFARNNVTEEDLLRYVVENIRRFKPKVTVGHDPLGEYGHGHHMVYSEILQKAVQCTMDPETFPDLAEKYGVWDVPKTYLHLYPENPIIMDWDQPMESFDGMTPYQVTKKIGFPCHVSQTVELGWYMAGADTAAEVKQYSPCEYGLFRSTVGDDVQKNDFFENVTTYREDREKAEEEARLEEERKAAETKPTEETVIPEADSEVQEEPERQEMSREDELAIQKIEAGRQRMFVIGCVAAGLLVVLIIVTVILMLKNRRY